MRIIVATEDFEAVGFSIPVAEFTSKAGLAQHPELRKLGPDVLADDFDPAKALANLLARGQSEIADALLNQRALAGLGNVYKSEVLFLCGINPFARVLDLTEAQLVSIIETAQRVLKAN